MLRHTPKLLNFLYLEAQACNRGSRKIADRSTRTLRSTHVRERDQYSKRQKPVKDNLKLTVIAKIPAKRNLFN